MFVLGASFELDHDRSDLAVIEARDDSNNLRRLEHPVLGQGYADTVSSILEISGSLSRCSVVVDANGPGQLIIEQLKELDLYPIGVTMTYGERVTYESGHYRVPIGELATHLQNSIESERLKIDPALPYGRQLFLDIAEFVVEIKRSAPEQSAAAIEYEPAEYKKGVIAIALAEWWLDFTDSNDFKIHSSR